MNTVVTFNAESQRAKALSYAAKTGTAIDLIAVTTSDAKEVFKGGPIALMYAIKQNMTAEEVEALPLPGSRWNQPAGVGNNNPDVFKWSDPSKPDAKEKEVSFYVVWSDNTPEGKRVVTELEWCTRVGQPNVKTDDIPQAWKDKFGNPQSVGQRKLYLEGRRGTVRKQYKDAIRLIWQVDMVNELDGCEAVIVEKEDGSGYEKEILVREVRSDKLPARKWKYYNVDAFLKLQPQKANEQGGSYAALEATAKRTPDAGKNKGTKVPALNSVQTPETMAIVASPFASYLDHAFKDKKGHDYAALLRHLTSDAGVTTVHTLDHIRNRLNDLFKMDVLRVIADKAEEEARAAA